MSIASERRRGRRSAQPPETPVAEDSGVPAVGGGGVSSANTLGSGVSTVETIPSVVAPAPTTISQRRRAGITTPARRATQLKREAAQAAVAPYGAFTPFVTSEGTVDLAKMVEEKGSGETAKMLTAA